MDELSPEYYGCSAMDDLACPVMPYLTDTEIEAAAEQADRFYESLACD